MSDINTTSTNSTSEGTEGTNNEKLFTQAQVNDIVRDRLARERERLADDETYRAKYESVLAELNDLKAAQLRQKKEDAYRALLTKANINEKRFPIVIRASGTEIDALELDENGAVKNTDKLIERIKEDWADFVVTVETRGADIAHPPFNMTSCVDAQIAEAFKPKI